MIYILGAGAIGCLWASRLSPDASLAFALSPRYAQQKKVDGDTADLLYHQPGQDLPPNQAIVKIRQISRSSPLNAGLLLVTTKSQHTLSALNELAEYLNPRTPIILFQNGMGSQQEVLNRFGSLPIYAAVSTEGANIITPFEVKHAGFGQTYIGALSESAHRLGCDTIIERLNQSGLCIIPDPDITVRLTDKLLINCAINPFTALENCPNGQVPQTQTFQTIWPELRYELHQFSTLSTRPRSESEIEAMVMAVIQSTKDNISSMLQDVRAGRETEIDSINGYVSAVLSRNHLDNQQIQWLTERVRALGN